MGSFSPMRRTATLLLALAATTVVVGCTNDQPAEYGVTTSGPAETRAASTAPPTPAPSPTTRSTGPTAGPDQDLLTAPEPPAALTGPATEANAAEVAVYFLRNFPYAASTGDLSAWDDLSGPTCRYCEAIREAVAEIYSAGNHSTGGAIDLGVVETERDPAGTFVVTLTMRQYPSQTLSPSGDVLERFPETKVFRPLVELESTSEGWVVTGVQMDRVA